MALSRVDASIAALYGGIGAAPTALFEYECAGGLENASDPTFAPAGWAPTHAACARLNGSDAAAFVLPRRAGPAAASLVELRVFWKPGDHYVVGSAAGVADALASGYAQVLSLGFVWPPPGSADAPSRYALPSMSKDDATYTSQDYWRGRVWAPMLQLVFWGLSQYEGDAARGATDGLVAQSRALLLRPWLGYDSDDGYAGTGRRVYENSDADTGEGHSYSSPAFPLYGWGALAGAMLCYAVLCYAMLCCAMLCYAMLGTGLLVGGFEPKATP
jgi:hypothetical protein